MKELVQSFPAQIEEAIEIANAASLKPATKVIQNVLICGLGGSGIGGHLLKSLLRDTLPKSSM